MTHGRRHNYEGLIEPAGTRKGSREFPHDCCSIAYYGPPNLTVASLEQVKVPASHTRYV
jgi:hypothetical protein